MTIRVAGAEIPTVAHGRVWVDSLNHISISVRDVDEASRFWIDLFGAVPHQTQRITNDATGTREQVFEVRISEVVLGLFATPGLVEGDHEFPHYAFRVTPAQMLALKNRLEHAGVTTHPIWTRNQQEGLMYFRDPTGNLFELYSPDFCETHNAELAADKEGGTFRPPIDGLGYEWKGASRLSAEELIANPEGGRWVEGIDHIALHVSDVDEAMRFWTEIFEGHPVKDAKRGKRPFHIEVGGTVFAFFELPGLTGWEHEYPHYGLTIEGDKMLPLVNRLVNTGVRVHPIWTRDQKEALMYFRDPSGNLFELCCPSFGDAADHEKAQLGSQHGGSFTPPVADLSYSWNVRH